MARLPIYTGRDVERRGEGEDELRVLIANEREDGLQSLAGAVEALGHRVIAREVARGPDEIMALARDALDQGKEVRTR